MSSDAFTAVGPRRPPGPFSWGCPACGPKEPFKSGKYPGCWNGAQATQCQICSKDANSKSCVRYGTNGKNGGKWKPWDPDNPPKPPAKPTTPAPRIPGVQTPEEKKLEKKLADKD